MACGGSDQDKYKDSLKKVEIDDISDQLASVHLDYMDETDDYV